MNSRATNEVTPLLLPTHGNGDEQNQRRTSWENYVLAVEKYPIRTKCLTALILFVASDAFAQVLEFILDDGATRTVFDYDWIRAMRFGAVGLFGAPWSHYYFYWLDHYLPPSNEPFTKRTALKVFIDQFVQAPILLAIMIFALSLMKGKGLDAAKEDLSNTFMESLIANCEWHFVIDGCTFRTLNACRNSHEPLVSNPPLSYKPKRETLDTGIDYQYRFCETIAPSFVRQCHIFLLDHHT